MCSRRGCCFGCCRVRDATSLGRLVATGGFDVAILDVDLRGETSARVAEALARRGIPFVVMSGYGGSGAREPAYEGHPRLAKPVDPVALLAALGKFVRR